mmetsp:Transcript_26278/g.67569  ORF Transcript_26278/g.67569 Transcript_26278/m.67569 type:complete len:379 (+) Transcript_26278:180-1316(+)
MRKWLKSMRVTRCSRNCLCGWWERSRSASSSSVRLAVKLDCRWSRLPAPPACASTFCCSSCCRTRCSRAPLGSPAPPATPAATASATSSSLTSTHIGWITSMNCRHSPFSRSICFSTLMSTSRQPFMAASRKRSCSATTSSMVLAPRMAASMPCQRCSSTSVVVKVQYAWTKCVICWHSQCAGRSATPASPACRSTCRSRQPPVRQRSRHLKSKRWRKMTRYLSSDRADTTSDIGQRTLNVSTKDWRPVMSSALALPQAIGVAAIGEPSSEGIGDSSARRPSAEAGVRAAAAGVTPPAVPRGRPCEAKMCFSMDVMERWSSVQPRSSAWGSLEAMEVRRPISSRLCSRVMEISDAFLDSSSSAVSRNPSRKSPWSSRK